MKYIAVFCSANELKDKYIKPAKKIMRMLSQNGYHLVWGGANVGLMKIIASVAKLGGSKLVGITHPIFEEFTREDIDELIVAKTLSERKALMLERCDAVLALVGGTGTLDEITEVIELRRNKFHDKPIVILNTEKFYDGLIVQLQKMRGDGLISSIEDLVHFVKSPKAAFNYINQALLKKECL